MLKTYISPIANDGILRVIEAQTKYLPQFGVEVTRNLHEADVICNHGTDLHKAPGVPSVHIGHGLYWSRQKWGDDFMDVNRMVVETMRHAVAHTAPSEWVSRAIRRGGFWYPEVVYHGVDAELFQPVEEHSSYIAWAKARADYVSDPNDVMRLAPFLPSREFRSTIGNPGSNLKIVGAMRHADVKQFIANAGVYLSTARETFGIATLEALAYGVPVAGWDWGGNGEIVVQGETGYLAPPGDYKALAECIELAFSHRERLSHNAVEDVRTRWRWEPRIQQYADIFKRVHERYNQNYNPKVSVIVTAYKLDEYLPMCLNSVQDQTMKDFECIVVDDANLPSTKQIVSDYASRDNRFHYYATPQNLGLVGARNYGLRASCGKYIRHVDADDFLAQNALELEATALDQDWGIHIAYGHIEVTRTDGSRVLQNGEPVRSGWPEPQFKWHYQMSHLNQLPSCVMARREVYERSGGYRERMTRNEDAEFWCRVTSLGFRAKKITEAVTYFHRERHDSKGATEWNEKGPEPDWTAWFPWRFGAHDFGSGVETVRNRGDRPRNIHLVPFGAQGNPPQGQRFWYVHDYAYPVISFIVTVGPGHQQYLIDALDSIQAQSFPDWECVVVNDTGTPWAPDIMGAPWAKVINMNGNQGVSAARNEGYKHVSKSSRFIVWVDADDYLLPWFLERMVLYGENNRGVIYPDLFISDNAESFKINKYPEFSCDRVMGNTMQYAGSSILYPREITDAMVKYYGGYDPDAPGMEDWVYQIGVHVLGFCAYHIPEPLFVYRTFTTTKREKDYGKIEAILDYINHKYAPYRNGEKHIMCGCGSPKIPSGDMPESLMTSSGNFERSSIMQLTDKDSKQQKVMMEYVGPRRETFSINSRVDPNHVTYRFGNNEHHRVKAVLVGDVPFLLSLSTGDQRDFALVTNLAVPETHDPAIFLGQPITT